MDNTRIHEFLESVYSIHMLLKEVGCLHHENGKRIVRYELTTLPIPMEEFTVQKVKMKTINYFS